MYLSGNKKRSAAFILVTVRKNKLMSNRKHNQIVEQLFFSFGCKHKWREIQIEPVTKYYSYKLLEEVDPIVSDSRYIVKRGTMKYDLMTYQNWSQFLVSEKLKSVLEKYDFNGYKCFPTDIEGISETYYGWLNINEVGPIIKEDRDKNLAATIVPNEQILSPLNLLWEYYGERRHTFKEIRMRNEKMKD